MIAADLIIFDCDGTLVDSEFLNNKATALILAKAGLPQYDTDYCLRHFIGVNMTDMAAIILAETGAHLPADFIDDYNAKVQELMPHDLRSVEGVTQILSTFDSHFKTCVASNGERPNVLRSIDIAGLGGYFSEDAIFTADMVPRPKPAPDLFLLAAASMGVKPDRTVVIEDSVTGTKAGIAAGMTVIGFTGTYPDPQTQTRNLLAAGARLCVERFSSLPHYIRTARSSNMAATYGIAL